MRLVLTENTNKMSQNKPSTSIQQVLKLLVKQLHQLQAKVKQSAESVSGQTREAVTTDRAASEAASANRRYQ